MTCTMQWNAPESSDGTFSVHSQVSLPSKVVVNSRPRCWSDYRRIHDPVIVMEMDFLVNVNPLFHQHHILHPLPTRNLRPRPPLPQSRSTHQRNRQTPPSRSLRSNFPSPSHFPRHPTTPENPLPPTNSLRHGSLYGLDLWDIVSFAYDFCVCFPGQIRF